VYHVGMDRMTLQYDVAGGRRNKLCDLESDLLKGQDQKWALEWNVYKWS